MFTFRELAGDGVTEQLARSFEYIGKDPIDLVQVHNLRDIPVQMGLLKELKQDVRVRYLGTTCTGDSGYPELAAVMKREPIDFIGVDYAVDNRSAAKEILPIARDKGIGVLVYLPFDPFDAAHGRAVRRVSHAPAGSGPGSRRTTRGSGYDGCPPRRDSAWRS